MKVVETSPCRMFVGSVSGRMQEGRGIWVRMATELNLDRDIDGTWLIYASTGPGDDDLSESIKVYDPQTCAAFDALFELLADPLEFKGCKIGNSAEQEVA